jgi:hypothetical protein
MKVCPRFSFYLFQLRTPFNWMLMNLSLTELLIASSGNLILALNSTGGGHCPA